MNSLVVSSRTIYFYLIGFIDLFAVSITIPLVPQYLKEQGSNPSTIGLIGTVYGAIQLFSSPTVGHLSDGYGKLHILCVCLVMCAVCYGVLSIAISSLFFFVIARIVLGIFKHTQDLCRNSLAEVAIPIEKTKCVGRFNAISTIGFIVGPSISGYLSNHFGLSNAISIAFFLCGSLFLLNAFIVQFILSPKSYNTVVSKNSESPKKPSREKSNLSIFQRLAEINWKVHSGLFISRFLMSFAVLTYRSSFILGVKNLYPHLSAAEVGYLFSYNALIGFVLGFAMSWVFSLPYYTHNEEKLQLHGSFVLSFGLFVIAISWNIYALLVGLAILVVGTTTSRACSVTLTMKRCNEDEVGKLLGLSSSMISIARSAAPFVAGLAQEYSYSSPAYISCFVSLAACWLFYTQVYCVPIASVEKTE